MASTGPAAPPLPFHCQDAAVISSPIPLDHAIFYAGDQLDTAARLFQAAGFRLTPLGRHNTGSINHLVILEDSYLEIIGLPPGSPPSVRPDLQSCTPGFNGLCFAEQAQGRESDLDARFKPTTSMSRPVDVDGASQQVRFNLRLLQAPPENFRVFLIDHLTPELIWRPEWQTHENGARRLLGIELPDDRHAALRPGLRAALDLAPDPASTASSYQAGGLHLHFRASMAPGAATLHFSVDDLDAWARRLEARSLPYVRLAADQLAVELPAPLSARLVFHRHAG